MSRSLAERWYEFVLLTYPKDCLHCAAADP